jgi:hypothetical protein
MMLFRQSERRDDITKGRKGKRRQRPAFVSTCELLCRNGF